MRKNRQGIRLLAVLLAVLLCCSGCSMDVESFLKPPRAEGEQQQIQAALETYIRDSGHSAARYTLHYPSEGAYTSAFVVCDLTGRPLQQGYGEAAMAIAFYSLATAVDEVHINLLRRSGEEWQSVGDAVGYGSGILQVEFGDLDKDGTAELITGWDTYSSRDRRMAVYSLRERLALVASELLYTQMMIGQLPTAGQEGILLMRIGTAGGLTAELQMMVDGRLASAGKAVVDSGVQQISAMTFNRRDEHSAELYVDVIKTDGTMVTELLLYDGERVLVPFYDASANGNSMTVRDARIPARDIDGDGNIDIPFCTLLAGYTPGGQSLPSYAWLTVWREWQPEKNAWGEPVYTVVNTADGYAVTLDRDQWDGLGTRYDSDTGTLHFYRQSGDWLRLRTGPVEDDAYFSLYEGTESNPACWAWIDTAVLDREKARYMVTRW